MSELAFLIISVQVISAPASGFVRVTASQRPTRGMNLPVVREERRGVSEFPVVINFAMDEGSVTYVTCTMSCMIQVG